jgi:exonuclease VII large subunit
LRWDLQKRLEALEAFTRGETDSIGQRLTNEHQERSQAVERLSRDLAETARHFEERITSLDNQMSKEIRDLRQQLLEHSKALSSEIKEQHDQLRAGLDHEAKQIRTAMTGRDALAEMFGELSLRLKNEFHLPGAA